MSSVFSISEGRFICSKYQLNFAASKEPSCVADRPCSSVYPQCTRWAWLSSGRVCKRWGIVDWISLLRNPCSPSTSTAWPRKGTFPLSEDSPLKFVTGHCGRRAKGEGCSEGSSDSSCTPELMQPYQLQPLLLLLIRVLHLAPVSSLQSVIKRW